MARYIDADALMKALNDAQIEFDYNYKGLGKAKIILSKQPTADVVEVVRCGQCKHWKINPNNPYGGYCRYCEGASIDHYCSYGERKNR